MMCCEFFLEDVMIYLYVYVKVNMSVYIV